MNRFTTIRTATVAFSGTVMTVALFLAPGVGAVAQTDATSGHPYDPCQMVSQQDVANAMGVATEQVFTPRKPTANECMWAVAGHSGVPAQQVALTVQTIGEVKHAHGMAAFRAIIGAVRQIPGAPITSPDVNRILDNAQAVADLGDRAGWKNGTLTVVKHELMLQVRVDATQDSQALKAAKTIAHTALQHVDPSTVK